MFKNLNFEALGVSGHQNELIELTLSFGFKGFDLDLQNFAQQVGKNGLDRARRLLDSARLTLGSFELPVDCDADEETFQQQLQGLPELAQLAADVGCKRCRATIAPGNDSVPYHECFELYRRRFRDVGDVLDELGIRLGLSFLAPAHHRQQRAYEFVHTFDAFLLLTKSVGSANVGLCLDTWHWHVSGGTIDQVSMLTADEIVAVDLADATTLAGDDKVEESTRQLPSEGPESGGLIDSPKILATLGQMGYEGPVTPRPNPSLFEGLRRDEIVKQTGEAIDKVWSAAKLSKRGKLVGSS